MSKFGNFKIKWSKSVEKLENGGRLGPPPKLALPKKKNGPLDPPVVEWHSRGTSQNLSSWV